MSLRFGFLFGRNALEEDLLLRLSESCANTLEVRKKGENLNSC